MRESPVRTLEDLCDKQAISDVIHRYASGVDARDWVAFRSCFSDVVEVDLSSWNASPPASLQADAWVAGVRAGLSGFDVTQHLSANHVIAIDGETARCTSYMQASHLLDGDRCLLGGFYESELLRTSAGWKIRRSKLHVGWREGDESVFERAARRASARASEG